MIPAVRTVSETDDVHVIEGLAFPFQGRDTYGTFFSARTAYHWDLFPDLDPAAVRADQEPGFIRPLTMHHGFDPDFGLDRIGGWSPVRMDADGVWVRAQIDKRQRYYATRIKPLLDAGALGLSGGSAEHSVRIDATGEVREWPAYEVALTPVESNPLAQLSVRAGETVAAFRIVEAEAAVRGWLPSGTTEGDLDDGDFAWVGEVDGKKVRKLPYKIHGKVDEDGWKAAWSRVHQEATDLPDGGETAAVKKLLADKPADVKVGDDAAKSGIRAADHLEPVEAAIEAYREGKRNSTSDAAALTTAHDNIASVLGMDCAPGDASARSGEDAPAFLVVSDPEPEPPNPLTAMATRAAEEAAAAAVRALTG